MTLKSDAKFKEKLACGFEYDMKNLVNFHPTTGSFVQSVYTICILLLSKGLSYKITEELSFMTLNSDAKFE